jgi:lipopolysaccharide export system protein LptA
VIPTFPFPRLLAASTAVLALALAAAASAEEADREKPINYSADTGEVNYQTKVGNLTGNVVITQGTLTIRADRMSFKQNADNSLSVTAYGSPVSFRQKRDNVDEYYEGFAQRAVYDGEKKLLELFDRALLKRAQDEIRSNYISYNTESELFKAEGRPDAPATPTDAGTGARVRGVFQPKEGEGLPGMPGIGKPGAAKDDAGKGKAKAVPGADAAAKGKGKAAPGADDAGKDKATADSAKDGVPLRPSGELAPAAKP